MKLPVFTVPKNNVFKPNISIIITLHYYKYISKIKFLNDFFNFSYLEDESEGSTCDLLGEAQMTSSSGGSEPSTWSTIANPRFTTYERLQKCWQGPEGRILTGKAYQADLDYELELLGIQGQPPHHIQTHSAVYQAEESASPPAFAGFSGGSFYQVDSIGAKPVYSLPDQPAKPVYTNPIQVYDPNEIPVEKVDVFEQLPPNVEPLFVKGKRSRLTLDHDSKL